MSISLADLRFQWQRARGLIHRGMTSLRARGWRATWAAVRRQFSRTPATRDATLYFPDNAPFAPFSVPDSAAPRASLIIPVYNQVAHTLACLRALAEHPPRAPCEILVIDDGSSDQTAAWMSQVAGLHFHRRAQNGGFIATCNEGATRARGETLVFLNNDTLPQPGWLDALLATFDAHPDVGLVGAQLLYPDGQLQEAGGVVFSDGSAWNYGRFEAPGDPRFASLRDADYCSGAALAIPRALFESLGGFDTRYTPAYYEDTDLAFAVRAAGKRVVYQPASRVIHLEGVTSGTDTRTGPKAYQVKNRATFLEKWRDVLATHPAPGVVPSPAVLHARQRQILIVDEAVPRPDRDSGSLRLSNLMRMLVAEGAHVVFLATEHAPDAHALAALQGAGVEVWYPGVSLLTPAWFAIHGPRFAVIAICRYYLADRILPLAKKHAPQARRVLDTIDLHYVREARAAALAGDDGFARTALRTRTRELAVIGEADMTLVVSATEQQLLAKDAPTARVEILSNLHQPSTGGLAFAQRQDLVFVGGFRHAPNVDGVLWFAREVLPRVQAQLPGVRLHCIGSDPTPAVQALADQPGILVHGHVPDLDPAMDGLRIAVAPLRFGAGVKGKVNLSMAHGQPVVATSCAVEGMHLQDGVDVLVADDPAAFAEAVVRLYRDERLWELLSRNGKINVEQHFSMDAARDVVHRVFFEAG